MHTEAQDRHGMHLWRQISEALLGEIKQGVLQPGGRLPASDDLAVRFGVNRHTVLRAISHLRTQGLVRVERGRGTYVVERPLEIRLDAHQRFEQNLLQSNSLPTRRLIAVGQVTAPAEIATPLKIGLGDQVTIVTLLGEGDGVPVNLNTSYLPNERLPGIADAFRAFGFEPTDQIVFSRVLAQFGIDSFRRKSIRLRSRPPTNDEARYLQLSTNEQVMETEVTSVGADETPLIHAFTRFCASRVEFTMEL